MPRGKKRADYRDYSIADRPQGISRDCVVRAMQVASGLDYDICYLAIALCGRRHNSGVRMSDYIRAYQKVGLCQPGDMINLKYDTFPNDNFIVLTRNHIFAVRNGKHSDGAHAEQRVRVRMAWRIPQTKG